MISPVKEIYFQMNLSIILTIIQASNLIYPREYHMSMIYVKSVNFLLCLTIQDTILYRRHIMLIFRLTILFWVTTRIGQYDLMQKKKQKKNQFFHSVQCCSTVGDTLFWLRSL